MEFTDFFGDIWSIDINYPGTALISVSADLSIRLYNITSEQIVPELERENAIDKNIDEELQNEYERTNTDANVLNKDIDKLVPIKKSIVNVTLAEDLMDSLDEAEKFKNEVYQYEIAKEEYDVKYIELLPCRKIYN